MRQCISELYQGKPRFLQDQLLHWLPSGYRISIFLPRQGNKQLGSVDGCHLALSARQRGHLAPSFTRSLESLHKFLSPSQYLEHVRLYSDPQI